MNDTNLKSIIYISKRCPYCRKLLLLLQNKPEIKGSIQITCIDDEPFPKIITSVPSMISDGELWNADELFAALEGRPNTSQQMNGQQQQQQQQQPQQQQTATDSNSSSNKRARVRSSRPRAATSSNIENTVKIN